MNLGAVSSLRVGFFWRGGGSNFARVVVTMSPDLKCSPREAGDCPIFGLCHRGHVHVATSGGVDDIDDFWLPLRRDLRQREIG